MPDIVVHNAMGEKVLKQLENDVSSLIIHDIFQFAVMGPDPYFYYRFFLWPFKNEIRKRSSIMHKMKTGEFLMELARQSQSRQMFSFLSGFLCHYALDSTTHPYINRIADDRAGFHTAIEHRLDVIELERQGKKRTDIMKLFTDSPDLAGVKTAIKKVYGWEDNYLCVSYRHMKLFHWIVKDQYGFLNVLLGQKKGSLGAISYCNHLCDDMDFSGFDRLEEEAVEYALKLITAAYDYRAGRIDEIALSDMIGNRTYSGGKEGQNYF